MRQANLFDFHGTLADVSGIRDLLVIRDYDGFYEQSLTCPRIDSIVQEARRSHEDGFTNLLFTGMPDKYVDGLNQWLARNDVPIDYIEMRKHGDWRKDFLVKRDMYLRAADMGYYVLHAWEDSPRVVKVWESQGIPVTVVPGWDDGIVAEKVDKRSDGS